MGSEIVICLRQMRSFRTPDKHGLSLQAGLMPRRSGVPVAIDDRRYRAGLFPVPCSLFPDAGDCHGRKRPRNDIMA